MLPMPFSSILILCIPGALSIHLSSPLELSRIASFRNTEVKNIKQHAQWEEHVEIHSYSSELWNL